jgi:hypothetical protein
MPLVNGGVGGGETIPPSAPSGVLQVHAGTNVTVTGTLSNPIVNASSSGISELTGDVVAGPGSGSVAASVEELQGNPLLISAPAIGDVIEWNGTDFVNTPKTPVLVVASIGVQLGTPTAGYNLVSGNEIAFPLDPVNKLPADQLSAMTIPLFTTAPAGTVLSDATSCFALNIDTTTDTYILQHTIVISNLDGSETMTLNGQVTIAIAGPGQTGNVTFGDLTVESQTGTDLVLGGGGVTSTAGGTFGIISNAQGSYT